MLGIASTTLKAVVLVHGGFVDGSGWEDVYKILKRDGYDVSIVQNPTTSLADDVAATRRVIDSQATTRKWRGWCTSPPLLRTPVSRCQP